MRSDREELRARRAGPGQGLVATGGRDTPSGRRRSLMKARAAIAAVVLAVALSIPANALAYLTWFEFARQSNIASTLTMVWQYGPGYYGTQRWRAGSGVSTDACWIGHGWLPVDYDYYSNGCIKVSRAGYPSDLRLVHDGWHSKRGDYRHGYFTIGNWLYVHD